MDLVEVANGIAETIGKVTTPLTADQRTFLAAALGPWLDRAKFEAVRDYEARFRMGKPADEVKP